jgi:hypothetical protein
VSLHCLAVGLSDDSVVPRRRELRKMRWADFVLPLALVQENWTSL